MYTRLIRTVSVTSSVSILTGFDCSENKESKTEKIVAGGNERQVDFTEITQLLALCGKFIKAPCVLRLLQKPATKTHFCKMRKTDRNTPFLMKDYAQNILGYHSKNIHLTLSLKLSLILWRV